MIFVRICVLVIVYNNPSIFKCMHELYLPITYE